jgi:hypothetical protein
MDINDLTVGQAKDLAKMFGGATSTPVNSIAAQLINKKVIVRTYSAGVWFGELIEKSGNEVILRDARRMWRWHAAKSISLSGVAKYGIKQDKSKICPALDLQWLEAIEITPCSAVAIESIEGAPDVEVA